MKVTKILVCIMMVLGLAFAKAQRGAKVAYIDMERILDSHPEYQQSVQQLDKKLAKWKREIDAMQTEIDRLNTKLKNERVLLTKELIEEKEEDIRLKEEELAEYQEKRFGAQGDFILQKEQLVKPIQDQVFNEVQKISALKKYDYVMNADESNLLFAADRHDITDLVLKGIERSGKKGAAARQAKEEQQEEIDKPYLSVEEAEARDEKVKKREAIQERNLSAREEKIRQRDSARAAKRAAYEARKAEIQKRRDSLKAAREAERKKKEEERENKN
ncbi:MAG: OmpH family outer membrane protein [Nonlabens sp.]